MHLSVSSCQQPWQHLPAAVDPSAQFRGGSAPVPLIDPPPQRRCLEAPRTEVEREVHDGREPRLELGGQHRAVAQRRVQRCLEVGGQVAFSLCLRDRRMLRIAKVSVADGSVASRADVGMRAAGIGPRHPMEPLESLGEIDGRLRHCDHGRTRSSTRPRNQKFRTRPTALDRPRSTRAGSQRPNRRRPTSPRRTPPSSPRSTAP